MARIGTNAGRGATGRLLGACAGVALAAAPGPVAAQTTAGEIVPDTFAPAPARRLGGSLVFTGLPGTEAPPGAERLSIRIGAVTLEGGAPELAGANAAYAARLTRGRIAASEIFEATADLEAAYAEAGLVLTRVVLPVQELRDGGTLRVTVVDGFVEAVDTSGLDPRIEAPVRAATEGLVGRPRLVLRDLERGLLLAGDLPGLALDSALAAGARPGGTVVALDGAFRPVTGFVALDGTTQDALGGYSLDAGIEINSPFGLGETIYLRFGGNPEGILSDDPLLRSLAAGAVVPLGGDGLTLNYEATLSETGADLDGAPTTSRFERHSLRLAYPVVRGRALDVSASASLDLVEDSLDLAGAPVFAEDLTVLRFGASARALRPSGGVIDAIATFSRGVDAFGAGTGAGVPASRQGAEAEFSTLSVAASYARPAGDFALRLNGRAQTSFGDPLVTSERFGIAGAGDLSAFEPGDIRGDSGWTVRGEVARPVATELGGLPAVVTPYAFAAMGEVRREAPTDAEADRTGATTVGIGVDVGIRPGSPFSAASLRIEYGKGDRDDGPDDKTLSIVGAYRF